jgi:uncharacterized membrane protein YeiB
MIVLENALIYLPAENGIVAYTPGEQMGRALLALTVEQRGLAVFSVLLGFSLVTASHRLGAPRHHGDRVRYFVVLGAVHGMFLFPFDVLLPYGVALAVMVASGIASRPARPRWWVAAAAALVVSHLTAALLAETNGSSGGLDSFVVPTVDEAFGLRLQEWLASLAMMPFSVAPILLPMLLGAAVAHRRLSPIRGRPSPVSVFCPPTARYRISERGCACWWPEPPWYAKASCSAANPDRSVPRVARTASHVPASVTVAAP